MDPLLAATEPTATSFFLGGVLPFIVFLGLYLLPWGIAQKRNAVGQGRVFLLNLFLGWTVVGWVVAFVMAVRAPVRGTPARGTTITFAGAPGAAAAPALAAGWYADPWGQARLRYHDGATWTPHVHA